jgi:hypothetical protein
MENNARKSLTIRKAEGVNAKACFDVHTRGCGACDSDMPNSSLNNFAPAREKYQN